LNPSAFHDAKTLTAYAANSVWIKKLRGQKGRALTLDHTLDENGALGYLLVDRERLVIRRLELDDLLRARAGGGRSGR
jgi:hypothetical protein